MDYYGFYTGQEFTAYANLGAHLDGNGAVFRTFAPNALRISVIGDFNCWQEMPMEKVYDGNFWECRVENAARGMKYKYRIYRKDGTYLDHCDPYGFFAELRPATASILWDLSSYEFHDAPYLKAAQGTSCERSEPPAGGVGGREPAGFYGIKRGSYRRSPMNIYEFHAGSWKKPEDRPDSWYSYRELAGLLIPFLQENHYNFVEIMPLNEYPCDQSWGYQATGFFSPTSRYGTPDDLKYLIDQCHQQGIGVILDFVPVHFAVNDYALLTYDGTSLYEYPHRDVGRNEWGSCNFMHSRGEVRSFLQSAAYYWLKEFHFDGLRVDAVSNLIYWQGNRERGENRPGIQFLQTMNRGLKERIPSALLIAEDSSAYQGVTAPVDAGGLGFDYKWDLGWMNDTLSYLQAPPSKRLAQSSKITFSMDYFYKETYLLPLSHDEVVHGKATIVQKMNGADYQAKFAQARLLYMYLFAHPGKKLNFMGNELGHLREWDETREMDWNLLQFPQHDGFFRFMRELNGLYLGHPAFYERDYDRDGFQWIDCSCQTAPVYAFIRKSASQAILVLLHFGDKTIPEYECSLPDWKQARLLFHSDWECFGGTTPKTSETYLIEHSVLTLEVKGFSAMYFTLR